MSVQQEYEAVLADLFQRFTSYQHAGQSALKPGLETTRALLQGLGNPENDFKIVHVAGTNGKGSVVHGIASVLMEAGHKVGVYSSPHLVDFRERFRINGALCSQEWVLHFWKQHADFFSRFSASFFEITTVMAFAYFSQEKVDYAVVEVGMGGRWDSTNVVNPIASVITRIGLDHQGVLGDTLEAIAGEKAGIIKAGVPVVCGENEEGVKEVFARVATEVGSVLKQCDYVGNWFKEENEITVREVFRLPMFSGISLQHLEQGLKKREVNTGFLGRWHIVRQEPLWVLDCCHNADGWNQALAHFNPIGKKVWILGFSADKDPVDFIQQIPEADGLVLVSNFGGRAMQEGQLEELLGQFRGSDKKTLGVEKLTDFFQNIENEEVNLFVGGSVFLLGEIFAKNMLPKFAGN